MLRRNTQSVVIILLLLLFSGFLFAHCTNLTLYADDYYYGTFFKNGPAAFWENTALHYWNMNGRALIHLLDEMLLLKPELYAALCPALLIIFAYLAARLLAGEEKSGSALHLEALVTVILTVGLNIFINRETLFWITGFFNYFVPVWLGIAAAYAWRKNTPGYILYPLCFLAGATTEQGGLMALSMLVCYGLPAKKGTGFSGQRPQKNLAPLCTLAGYTTVLLSLGTLRRALAGGTMLRAMMTGKWLEKFTVLSDMVMGRQGFGWLFAALFLVTALLSLLQTGLPKGLALMLPEACLILICLCAGFTGPVGVTLMFGSAVICLCCMIFQFWRTEALKNQAVFLTALLVSLALLLFVPDHTPRTVFPAALLLICVLSDITVRCITVWGHKKSLSWCALLFFLVGVICFVPTFCGYARNKAVTESNAMAMSTAKNAGQAELCADFERLYGYTMFFEDGFFLKHAIQYYGLPESAAICLTSDRLPVVFVGAARASYPAIFLNDTLYLPLEPVVTAGGGRLLWQSDRIEIEFGGRHLVLEGDDKVLTTENGEAFSLLPYYESFYGKLYIASHKLCSILSLQEDKRDNLREIRLTKIK